MKVGLIVIGAILLIILYVATIKPHGKNKKKQPTYSKAELVTLAVSAAIASVLLFIKLH
ncbi:hypothetical protein [Lacticaseibacillus zhaodongensis]|uniref:hypothetical protein n=1 Tax=Lacticaseibacillus zhaodongensis TaxID=2668065 RepID=UPI0012D36BC9|nr:hypothetical protein [Lacticaseibacillus zhaodongensis]